MNDALDLAKHIKTMDFNSPEFEAEVACKIKKLVHGEKFSTYHKVFMYLKHSPRRPRLFKKSVKRFADDFLKSKIETHREFMGKDWKKQMYGYFDWEKKQ